MSAAERRATVAAVAERLGLTELLDARPAELSGGDQQRVALARAMVRRPAVWLMDEPLGTLDADRRIEMCEFLRAQQLELGITTVYVTHDQDEAMRLADRIVVMDEGRDACRSARRSRSTTVRPRCSWPDSSAARA